MLHTTDNAAVESLTSFATTLDYALDDAGNLAYEYNLPLSQVGRAIAENDRVMTEYYTSLGY
jgi:hypothetical protein